VRATGIAPAQVLCSPSLRTRETLDGVAPGGETLIEPELYEASCQKVLARLRRVPEEVPSVMVVGHNPAMQMLVLRVAGDDGREAEHHDNLLAIRDKFPTGALATLTLECEWRDLGPGCGKLVAYVRPRALG
jgi:phosphohistidine phosphatase